MKEYVTKLASELKKDDVILERHSEKLKPVGTVKHADRGCDQMHVHVITKEHSQWCYDNEAHVMVVVK